MSYIDVPWRHQGRSRLGVDCVGLVTLVAKDLKLFEYDDITYSRYPDGKTFLQNFRNSPLKQISVIDATTGDVVIFKDNIYPCHCGILAEDGHLIHAYAARRRVVREYMNTDLSDKIVAAFRFPDIL
jgi:cell wall-associated NlpC family hydrolase